MLEKNNIKQSRKFLLLFLVVAVVIFSILIGIKPMQTASAMEQTPEATMQEQEITISKPVLYEGNHQPTLTDNPQGKYDNMKNAFYLAFNSYVVPTLILFAVCAFVAAGVKLGIEISKAEDDAKRAEVKKRMVHWAIGIVVVMMSPLLVQGIAEIAMGFASGLWTL